MQYGKNCLKETAIALTPLDQNSQEYKRIAADKKFLDACEILAADGGMFLVESGQLSKDGEKFSATFNVANELSKSTGEYKQLVYNFDGKESAIYFNEKNDKFMRTTPSSNQKLTWPKWPPSWWPGSGNGGISTGGAGIGHSWSEWQEVSRECRPNLNSIACPIHIGEMRKEQRTSNTGAVQTRSILIHCGCIEN